MKLIIKLPKQHAKPATNEAAERQEEHKHASTSERGLQQNRERPPPPEGDGNGTTTTTKTQQAVRFRDKVTKASVMKTPTLSLVNQKEKKSRKRKQPPDGGGGAGPTKTKKVSKLNAKKSSLPKIRFQVTGAGSGGVGSEGQHDEGTKVRKGAGGGGGEKKRRKMSLKESIAIREKIKSVIADIERRDTNQIFKYPVTEEIAPGYFSIVKVPMDTSTMSGKLENNEYTAWEVFWEDCKLMFRNAMAYNPDESLFFKVAEKLLRHTAKVVREASNGSVDVRDVLQKSHAAGASGGGGPTSSLGSFQVSNKSHHMHHRRNESIGSEFFSGLATDQMAGGVDQNGGTGTTAHHTGNHTTTWTLESVLSLQGQPSGSKNVIKNALQRRHTFRAPLANQMMGALSDQQNGQGMPFVDGTSHLRMKTVGIEAYMQSLRTFCRILPKQAQSYILRNAAERINPGIIARMEQQKQKQKQQEQQ